MPDDSFRLKENSFSTPFKINKFQVSESISCLMGHNEEGIRMTHVDDVFYHMDLNGDGLISKEEFFTYCMNTQNVRHSLEFLP